MTKHRQARTRRPSAAATFVGVMTIVIAGCAASTRHAGADKPTHAGRSKVAGTASTGLPSGDPNAAAPAPAATSTTAAPIRLAIPRIEVNSSLTTIGLSAQGRLQSPPTLAQPAWYAGGVRPGDVGPAVVVGHVDSRHGPAVFYRLKDLHRGDDVTVTLRSGTVLTYAVDTVRTYAKNTFPTTSVYGSTAVPVLRLVTCAGDWDQAKHTYVDNLVVSAQLVERRTHSANPRS